MFINPYSKAVFLKSAARVNQLPPDQGYEVAFAGISNVGKSSALNCLTQRKNLARTSKTPGRTQLINLFTLDEQRRLVDLPGYGYAQVPLATKLDWQKNVTHYLEARQSLQGLVLLMDVRHPLKELDENLIDWAIGRCLPVHILLTKSDKLNRSEVKTRVQQIKDYYQLIQFVTVDSFSSLKKEGLEALVLHLNQWFNI